MARTRNALKRSHDLKARVPILFHDYGYKVKEIVTILGLSKSLVYNCLKNHARFGVAHNPHLRQDGRRRVFTHEDEKLRCMKEEEVPRTSGEMSGRRLFVRLSIDECILVYSVYDVTLRPGRPRAVSGITHVLSSGRRRNSLNSILFCKPQ